jgi:hypothetical protein
MPLNRLCLVVLGLSATLNPAWGQVERDRDSKAARTAELPDL